MVVLAATVAADPVQRRMPSGDEVTELRLSGPEAGRPSSPYRTRAWHATVGARIERAQFIRPRFAPPTR